MRQLARNTAGQELLFFLASATDGKTGVTGKAAGDFSPKVWRKPGGSFAAVAGTFAGLGYGWYTYTPTAGELDTVGEGALHLECTGADPVDRPFMVGIVALQAKLEGDETVEQTLRLLRSVLVAKSSGGCSASQSFRDAADAKNRVVWTVDGHGNRTAVTVDGT